MLALLFCCVSCLNEDKVSTSPQAAITSFTIGAYDVKVPSVTDDGRDTVILVRDNGTLYPMTVDQVNNRIYNADSLAYGSILTKVTSSVSGVGTIIYRYADNPTEKYLWTYYDSIDFSRPLLFDVISSDGSFTRTYQVNVNVEKVFPDSLLWQGPDNTDVPVLKGIGAAFRNDSVFFFGTDTQGVKSVSFRSTLGGGWNGANAIAGLPDGWNGRVTVCAGRFYTVAGGALYGSADGITWSMVKSGIKSIIVSGNDTGYLWAVTEDSMIVRSSDMTLWADFEKVPRNFPDSAAVMYTYQLATNKNLSRTLLVGMSSDTAYASVWSMLADDTVWTKIDNPSKAELCLPAAAGFSVIRYDNSFFCLAPSMGGFRQSDDNGVTWGLCTKVVGKFSSLNRFMQLPSELSGAEPAFTAVTDNNGYIWIMTDDGRVWHGAVNRLRKR
jgi:hypothetical protein